MRNENSFTILIVEDEEDTLDLLATLLRRQGYRVRAACTGAEGLAAAQDPDVALVLLDIMLPDQSGFDVCLKVKENRPLLPIVILSVRGKPIDVITGLDSGADDYVTKPFVGPVLLARVRAALRAGSEKADDARPQTTEQVRTRVSDALLAVAQPLGRLRHPKAIADTIVERIEPVLNVEHRAICIWREEKEKVVREHTSASDHTIETALQALGPEWDQALYQELQTRQAPITTDVSCPVSPAIRALHAELGARATLVAPIVSQDKLFGALILACQSRSTFSAAELDIITGVTCQAGIALGHARFLSRLEQDQKVSFEQLRQASELLSIVPHELRSPVAAIKGFVTTLLINHRYWDSYEREAFLENVNQSVDQLSRIVENVLEMGRLDKGLQLYKRPTQLASLVRRVLHDLSFQSAPCELVNEVPAHLPMIAIDPLRIERVLRNLLENSVKFSPQGGRIRVFARLMEKEIEVGVEDQGIGISPEHLPHIFERFYQAGQMEAHREGIGLGLYIVKELIQAHGGQIWAESQPGKGTTIYFTLSLNDSTFIPEHTSPDSSHTTPISKGQLSWSYQPNGRPTVLIVEDDPQMLQSLEKSLKAEEFETLSISYGSQAIELVQTEEPDLVLLDLLLPDIDGFAVCERVRRFSNIPIIIITGVKAECDKVRGLVLGADDYLIKPFSDRELVARVRAVLRRAQVPGRVEPAPSLRFDGLEIDPVRHEVRTSGGPVKLTPTEHKLLCCLASNAGRVLTHRQLLSQVWGYECDDQSQYLWVNISRLRRKIEPDPCQPRYILTEPGIGYRFSGPDGYR